ncbi:MAG: N-6 DNA methylase [Thermodesulfobacteriota bacterium]|nr:N-6 DNA methylase [Thermodesulfobacteriota bacterium]
MRPPHENSDIKSYLINNLYDRNFFHRDIPGLLCPIEDANKAFDEIKSLYTKQKIDALNESQLEERIIKPVLECLGWHLLSKESKIIQGKRIAPDWTLFAQKEVRERHLALDKEERKAVFEGIISFCESKAADKPLDTKKASKLENPYVQLLEYLNYTRISFGFLSNGREWWLVDNSRISSEKRYLRVKLEKIIEDDAAKAFRYFYHFFRRDNFIPEKPEKEAPIKKMARREAMIRREVEEDLRRVVYGTDGRDSLFERLGRALYLASGEDASPENLWWVFENSLYLVFRLLFIAYFEDKYGEQLEGHPSYKHLSLKAVHDLLDDERPFLGWNNLKLLFTTLADGNADLGIPLLNGGLFEHDRASLLNRPQVIDNAALKTVLDDLFYYEGGMLRRDFRTLSITHLGSIYEGLLEFEFRVTEETLYYLEYRLKRKSGFKQMEGYFDTYEAETLRSLKGCEILAERHYPKAALYLVSSQNSRKASGSYYTPAELSFPLVKRAIDHHLDKLDSVLDLRILDNACGSGHLLIEALNYLTRKALERLEDDGALAAQLAEEKGKIENTLRGFGLEVDEFAVLKRILLKQVVYGVDMQPFAVELAHLGLWIDTFVFGTPLSFIEHRVKVGNSLIGTTIRYLGDHLASYSMSLLRDAMKNRFKQLQVVYKKLSAIRDTTPEEVARSNAIYRNEIRPALEAMDRVLSLINLRDMLRHEGKEEEATAIERGEDFAPRAMDGRDVKLCLELAKYKERYRFFNWELEFPEAFAGNGRKGFHIIVGNPPWDKTKFLEPDFFSQYRSNYRTMTNKQKAAIKADLLDKPHILKRYNEGQTWVQAVNEYYKAHYPYNAGSGDGNIFRFFVERNLSLLLPGGTLNYVLPTALLTEEGSDTLRQHIFEHYRITRFDGFENRERIFPDVDTRYKFGLLQIENAKDADQTARMRFMLTNPTVLEGEDGVFEYAIEDVRATSPRHMAYMEVGGGRDDLEILRRLYARYPELNLNWLDFRNELHATNDKGIFIETDAPAGLLPLYKGASVWQYDSRYAGPEYWLDPKTFDDYLRNKEITRMVRDIHPALAAPPAGASQVQAVLDALGLKNKKELARFVRPDRSYYRLGFRDIASDTNERTLVAAIVPKDIGAQNTLWVSIPKYYYFKGKKNVGVNSVPLERLFYAQALFNSIVVDWTLRFSAAIHVNKTYLTRLPLPQPSDTELAENPVYRELVLNSLSLSLHHNQEGFAELQGSFGLTDADLPHTKKQADMLKIRNDCLIAGLYGVSKEELGHMLGSFKVLGNKRPQYVKALLEAYASYPHAT